MTPNDNMPEEPIQIRAEDSVAPTIQEALALHKTGTDSEGLFIVEPDRRAIADVEGGTITGASFEGAPSQGEDDTLACASHFVTFLRSQGETWWDDPTLVDPRKAPWVDCEARDRRDPNRHRLRMQVQRAMIGKEIYSEWHTEGRLALPPGVTAQHAAAMLMDAVENKRHKASAGVILLLDAGRLPWLALAAVVAEFRGLYAHAQARKLEFDAMYVVLWSSPLTIVRRLDP